MAMYDFQSFRFWKSAASEAVFGGVVLSFLRSSKKKLSLLALLLAADLIMMAAPELS